MKSLLSASEWAVFLSLVASSLAQCAVMVLRRAWREFPAFTVYCFVLCARLLVLLALALCEPPGQTYLYLRAYLLGSALLDVAMFAVTLELFSEVLMPGAMTPKKLSAWIAFVTLVTASACLAAGLLLPAPDWHGFFGPVVQMGRSLTYAGAGAIAVLAASSASVGIRWRPRAVAIACGLVLTQAVPSLVVFSESYFQGFLNVVSGYVSSISVAVALIFWSAVFYLDHRREPEPGADAALELLADFAGALRSGVRKIG